MTVNPRRNPPNPATHKQILVSKATTTLPPAPRHRTRARLAAVVGAVASAVAVWLIARYGTGLHLHTPAFGPAHRPATLTSGVAAAVTATASAAACGVLYLIERTARNARRAWILTSLTALAVSLPAPLSGHGVTGTDRLALICRHLAAGTVLIPVLALTIRPSRRPADDAVAGPGGQAAVAAKPAGCSAQAAGSQ